MTHSWDISIYYHRCPQCRHIFESRGPWTYRLGQYVKELTCGRCHHAFKEVKKRKLRFGPLIGDPQPYEWDWES